jgi:hypothetical protein
MEVENEILDQVGIDVGESVLRQRPVSRKLDSWLKAYQEYTEDFEPPQIFNKWVGLLTLSAVTQRRVWLEEANNCIYPNLFVVLVAASGVGKGQSMREALPFIAAGLGSKHISSAKITAAQFAKKFSQQQKLDPVLGMCTPYLIWAEEFPSFLGQDAYKTGMIADLTILYDNPEIWVKETKSQGVDELEKPYLCLLAGTTPQGIFDVLPAGSVTQGFTARLMFIHATYNSKRVVEKPWTAKHETLRGMLLNDIRVIAELSGPMRFTDIARTLWTDYYMHRPQAEDEFTDTRLQGYAARKPFYVKKIATLLSVSETDSLLIEAEHVETALSMLQEIDDSLKQVYQEIAPSTVIQHYAKIVRKLRIQPGQAMSRSALQQSFCYILAKKEFDEAMQSLIEMGLVEEEHIQSSIGGVRFSRWYKLTPAGKGWGG